MIRRSLNIAVCLLMLLCSSCVSLAPKLDYNKLVVAADRLGLSIEYDDNHSLYLEVSEWVGTPYCYGGRSSKCVDCSGFVHSVYKKVYRINLSRSSAEQFKNDCWPISKRKLKEGDLVFFSSGKNGKGRINHVGIYLKDDKFIHSSSSRGVIVSDLDEYFYKSHWYSGGRVKRRG